MSNTMKRIHDLFAQGKKPTSLTQEERKTLQRKHATDEYTESHFKALITQSKKETPAQAFARFEKSVLAALKDAKKEVVSTEFVSDLRIEACGNYGGGKITMDGLVSLSDVELIKFEHSDWDFVRKQKAKEAKEKAAASKAQAQIEEQNQLIKELTSMLKAKKDKPAIKSAAKKGKSKKAKSGSKSAK